MLQSCRETDNDYDSLAVAVTEDDTIITLYYFSTIICDLFYRKGGTISCIVTGLPQYSKGSGAGWARC